jgi:hypothetical protein
MPAFAESWCFSALRLIKQILGPDVRFRHKADLRRDALSCPLLPAFEPTPEQRDIVEKASGFGLPHEHICQLIASPRTGRPIDRETLRKHFRTELHRGHAVAGYAVANALYQHALGKGPAAVTAAIWWTKVRMGWKETTQHQHLDEHGNPTNPVYEVTVTGYDEPEPAPAPKANGRAADASH